MGSQERTALVTGGNRGIGLEVCRQLAARGLRVVLTARDRAKGERAAAEISTEVTVVELDVTSQSSIMRAANEIRGLARGAWGIDVLVNNAAILLGENDEVLDMPLDDVRATFESNVFACIAVCQAFVPGMVERAYGRVVNVSSRAGQISHMG